MPASYNADIIVERTAPRTPFPLVATSPWTGGTSNTWNTWYECDYYPLAPNSGLPVQGSTITITNTAFTDYHYLGRGHVPSPDDRFGN